MALMPKRVKHRKSQRGRIRGDASRGNRVVFGAPFTMMGEPNPVFGEPGYYGARSGRYAGERAAGGVGVVIVGHAHVHPTTAYSMRNNAIAWLPRKADNFLLRIDAS